MTLNARLAKLEQQAEPGNAPPEMSVEEIIVVLDDLERRCEAGGHWMSIGESNREIAQRLWAERSFYPGFLRSLGYGRAGEKSP